jgi:hypothetical protein
MEGQYRQKFFKDKRRLKAYRDAGASRIVLFSQPMVKEIAEGKVFEWLKRVAPIVERAQTV